MADRLNNHYIHTSEREIEKCPLSLKYYSDNEMRIVQILLVYCGLLEYDIEKKKQLIIFQTKNLKIGTEIQHNIRWFFDFSAGAKQ